MQDTRKYDLEERTLRFSKSCIEISCRLERNRINHPMIDQLMRSATSVGANYREANEASSKKEFFYRLCVCRKEAKETKYWLELLRVTNQDLKYPMDLLINEATELVKIFSTIVSKYRPV